MMYLLNHNYLPWHHLPHELGEKYDLQDLLSERLNLQYTKSLFRMAPRSLRFMIKKIVTLKFEEEPPYDFIIDILNAEIVKAAKDGPPPSEHRFEWCDATAASKDEEAISPICEFRSEFIKNNVKRK